MAQIGATLKQFRENFQVALRDYGLGDDETNEALAAFDRVRADLTADILDGNLAEIEEPAKPKQPRKTRGPNKKKGSSEPSGENDLLGNRIG